MYSETYETSYLSLMEKVSFGHLDNHDLSQFYWYDTSIYIFFSRNKSEDAQYWRTRQNTFYF